MAVLPKLTVRNKHQRMAFAEWAQNNEVSFNNVWSSDEAHFYLYGVVNKQNMRFCDSMLVSSIVIEIKILLIDQIPIISCTTC
jgi:hypothetical protein